MCISWTIRGSDKRNKFKNKPNTGPSTSAQSTTVTTCIPEGISSHSGPNTRHSKVFRPFSLPRLRKCRNSDSTCQRTLPSKSFPLHHSQHILQFNSTHSLPCHCQHRKNNKMDKGVSVQDIKSYRVRYSSTYY